MILQVGADSLIFVVALECICMCSMCKCMCMHICSYKCICLALETIYQDSCPFSGGERGELHSFLMFLFKIYADDKNTAGINIYIYVNMSMCMYMCARMFLFLLTIVLMFDRVFCSLFGFFFVFHKFTWLRSIQRLHGVLKKCLKMAY